MAVVTPPPRIGKTTGPARPRPADSEKLAPNAAFHVASEAPPPMAKLSPKTRKALPTADFAGPARSFPIPDKSHARNALARVAKKSPAVKSKVRAAVKQKFPGIGQAGLINRG
jgi:hypothetical protein